MKCPFSKFTLSQFFVKGRRQKQGWNADNKVSATSFDDLFEGQTKSEETKGHRRTETSKDTRTAWASSGLGVI